MPTIRSQIDGLVADRVRAAVRTAILIDRAEAHGRSTVIVRTRNIEDGRQAVYDALAGRSLLGGCATPEYSIARASVLDERHGLALAPRHPWVPELRNPPCSSSSGRPPMGSATTSWSVASALSSRTPPAINGAASPAS